MIIFLKIGTFVVGSIPSVICQNNEYLKIKNINPDKITPITNTIIDSRKFCQKRKIPINIIMETSSNHLSKIVIGVVLEIDFPVFCLRMKDLTINPEPPGESNIDKPAR